MMPTARALPVIAAFAMQPMPGATHHSMAEWDTSVIEEMEGEIVNVVWRNPHIRWTMRIRNEAGEDELWTMAGTSPNHLTRRGVTVDTLRVGDIIRVVGSRSTRRPLNFIVNSALLPDRAEVLLRGLGPAVDPHWPNSLALIGTGEWGAAEAAAADPRGLFTVWRSVRGVGGREPFSLTPEAEAVLATWNVADNWVVRCERRGMPSTMGNPYPREFVDSGDSIVLRIEEHDNVRVIHMSDAADPAAQPASRLGFSVGHWENERTLVVETTRIDFPWYNTSGVPQNEDVTVFERFTLSEDELRLGYEQIVTDPATFTEPAHLTGEWAAIPGIEIKPFDMDCSDNAYLLRGDLGQD